LNLIPLLLITLLIAITINIILKRFNIPTIIGYILTGVIIKYLFSLQHLHNETLYHIAEFGIVFLMFTIGLEFSIRHLWNMKKEVFVNGFLQVFITGNVLGAICHEILGMELKTSIIVGFALSLSSTAIVLKILNENREINKAYGRKALGILLFQDIAVIPILLMISIFTSEDANVSTLILNTVLGALSVFGILFIVGKYFINKFLSWVVLTDSTEIFISSILLIVIGSSFIAYYFGFSYSLGAFIAGMMIAESKFKYQIEADLTPFRDLLLGVFFITVGMQIDLEIAAQNIGWILAVLFGVMFIKALIIFIILSIGDLKRTALKTALSLMQIGEFALAIFSLAHSKNLLDDQTNQILILAVVFSMIISPFVLNHVKKIAGIFIKEKIVDEEAIPTGYHNHIIICGYGPLGQKIAKKLKDMNIKYLIIEYDIELVKIGKSQNEPVYFGNAAQKTILEAANIKEAIATIVAIENSEHLRLVCEAISSVSKFVNTVVKVKDLKEKRLLEDLHINHIVVESEKMAEILTNEALICKI